MNANQQGKATEMAEQLARSKLQSLLEEQLEAQAHARKNHTGLLNTWLVSDQRLQDWLIQTPHMMLDLSRTFLTTPISQALIRSLWEQKFEARRTNLLTGGIVNNSELRPAWHAGSRLPDEKLAASVNVPETTRNLMVQTRKRLMIFAEQVRQGELKGITGKPFRDIIHIGIGGSDLGPQLVHHALSGEVPGQFGVHFISNIEGKELAQALARCDAQTTLIAIASKSFTTQETLLNAQQVRHWLEQNLGELAFKRQCVAMTAKPELARAFGIEDALIFPFPAFIGGRYSLWSSVGLTTMISLGTQAINELHQGAHAMDVHFATAPPEGNLPIMLALNGIWNRVYRKWPNLALLPYAESLRKLPAYLQQLDMESNGKSVSQDGTPIYHPTGPIVFGTVGTDAQHAICQLLHQGTDIIPCEFILTAHSAIKHTGAHALLNINAIAQADAMALGRNEAQSKSMLSSGLDQARLERVLPYSKFAGDRPSALLIIKRMNAFHLGYLLALYEHKIFTQGVWLDVNSFDQFGVECGKTLARRLSQSTLQDGMQQSSATRHSQTLLNQLAEW